MNLTIASRTSGTSIVILELSGRLTVGAPCQRLESEVEKLVSAGIHAVFDLTDVSYLDSTGVGTLVMSARKLKDAGGQLRLAGAGRVVEVLRLTQTDALVPTHASVAEALAAFGPAANSQPSGL